MAFPLILAATPAAAQSWRTAQAVVLRQLVTAAADDALPVLDCGQLDSALREGEGPSLDRVATDIALRLASMHLLGASSAQQRTGWEIADSDRDIDVQAGLDRALAGDALAAFFASLRPSHPDYAALRAAYAQEKDAGRKLTLGRNMERWRWLPRDLGDDYLLVNAACSRRACGEVARWRAHGRSSSASLPTPTPVFSTLVTGVTFNPWWTIPASIVRERGGRFPASQGYVRTGGQWRQRPGPGNALGPDEAGHAQSLQGLHARHAQQGPVLARYARVQPWLRSRRGCDRLRRRAARRQQEQGAGGCRASDRGRP
jgi:hypothetical protein